MGLAMLVLLVVGLELNVSNIIGLIGSLAILALVLFLVGAFLIGFLLGTAQRNVSVANLVSAQNFQAPKRCRSCSWPPSCCC